MAIEFAEKLRGSPSIRPPTATRSEGPVAMLASNESPYPPIPAVIEAVTQRALGRSTATPTRRTPRCAAS